MKQETITRVKIEAAEGMVLTDGTVYGKVIFMASEEDASRFYEIPDEEYAAILAAEEEALRDYHSV